MPSKWLTRVSPSFSISGNRCQRKAFNHPRESGRRLAGLVGPQAIELLAQDVGFEQPPIGREERLQLLALRAAHRLPPPQQEPALPRPYSRITAPARKNSCRRTSSSAARVLEDMELVEDDLRRRQHLAHRVEIRPMHVGAGGARSPPVGARRGSSSASAVAAPSVRSWRQAHHLAVHHVRQHGPELRALPR